MPANVGRGFSFAFEVDGIRTNNATFAFESPTLHSVAPSVVDAEGDTITIVGDNFGFRDPRGMNASLVVRLDDVPCIASWVYPVRVIRRACVAPRLTFPSRRKSSRAS